MPPINLCVPIHPYAHIPPIHLYFLPIPYIPHMSWRHGAICTPHMSWGLLRGISTSVSISVSVSTSIYLSVYNSHTSCLSYWTGCLWMSAMLHAVVPFFVVFIMSQASTTMAMTTTPLVTVVCVLEHCLFSQHLLWLPP